MLVTVCMFDLYASINFNLKVLAVGAQEKQTYLEIEIFALQNYRLKLQTGKLANVSKLYNVQFNLGMLKTL